MRYLKSVTMAVAGVVAMAALPAGAFQDEGTVRIGSTEPLTGPGAVYGQPNIVGKFIAVDEINAAGGIMIDGKKVKIDLISEDDQAKPDQGVTIFRKLEGKDQALAITGTIYSRVSETMWGLLQKKLDDAGRDGAGGDAEIVAFRLVVAEDAGAQRPLAAAGPRRPVVGGPMRRHEEGGDRVDEGRLAGADVAGEEVVAAIELEGPDPPVERAPVEDLQAVEAEARTRLVRHEVEEQGLDLSLHHARLPIPRPLLLSRQAPPGTRRGGRPARPATRHPRTP